MNNKKVKSVRHKHVYDRCRDKNHQKHRGACYFGIDAIIAFGAYCKCGKVKTHGK